ncbi:MAG: AAA family ATPase [Sutterellaceae bacterium]|nr:AAA family ATPase [Burkholderiaceae bacterium]MCX7900724.1 AAA family ATPase [Burkholderiaceae bacterium]MDW8429768.1 AAA family ATPase [Sutterellaceae bacterium]
MSADLYLDYYALAAAPFALTAQAPVFYEGASRGDILRALRHALVHEQGIVLVVGEVGTGKSALCRKLLQEPPQTLDLAYIPQPSFSRTELLEAICRDLGIADLRPTALEALQRSLIERHGRGRHVAVLIDEAHLMPQEALEEVRLLTNLETAAGKLLTLALFAQPELLRSLAQPPLRALRDRIAQLFELQPLRPAEVADYVDFRLRAAGYCGDRLFEPAAIRRLARRSGGRHRPIHLIADRALLACFSRGGRVVTARDVARSERDLDLRPPRRWRWLPGLR